MKKVCENKNMKPEPTKIDKQPEITTMKKKKKYVKPELTKLGDLDEFVKGTPSNKNFSDIYSETVGICDCTGQTVDTKSDPNSTLTCNEKTAQGYFQGQKQSQNGNCLHV